MKNLITSFIALTALGTAASAAFPETVSDSQRPFLYVSTVSAGKENKITDVKALPSSDNGDPDSDEEVCKVTVNVNTHEKQVTLGQIQVISIPRQIWFNGFYSMEGEVSVNVIGTGTYDVLSTLQIDDTETYFILRENVEITGDTSLSLDLAEAKNQVVFDASVLPDGSRPVDLSLVSAEDGGNTYLTNIKTRVNYLPIDKGVYELDQMPKAFFDANNEYIDPSVSGNFYFDNTAKLGVCQLRTYATSQGNIFAYLTANGTASQTITLSPDDYYNFHVECQQPLELGELPQGWINSNDYAILNWSLYNQGTRGETVRTGLYIGCEYPDVAWQNTFVADNNPENPNEFWPHITAYPSYLQNSQTDMRRPMGILLPSMVRRDGKNYFVGNSFWEGMYENFGASRYSKSENTFWNICADDYDSLVFGSMAPIAVTPFHFQGIRPFFEGPLGELRDIDLIKTAVEVKKDGETVCDNPFDFLTFSTRSPGVWDITLDNTNFKVKEQQGRNLCQLHLNVTSTSRLAPTITKYALRNSEGLITNTFSAADDATLQFYAGAFEYKMDPSVSSSNFRLGYAYSPLAEVKVESAPCGTEQWQQFTVNEDPEKFFMPGAGMFYQGSLASLGEMADGAYDLRVSLTDEEGNTQVQTISPAFFINSFSGIEEISDISDLSDNDVTLYNLNGQRVDNRNLQKGIYIVKRANSVQKVIIR